MIDLRNLETFVWVARLGGFRLAAEQLNMTQPAISARIALLEQDLGVGLFESRPRRGVLTPAGLDLLRYAERLLSLREEMIHTVGGGASVRAVLRVGVPETVVHTWLPILVDRIAREHGSLTLDIEVDSSPNLRDALAAGRLDLAVTHGPCNEPNLRSELLCSYPLAWMASASLPLAPGQADLAALAAFPIITFRRSAPPYIAIRQLLDRQGLARARMFGSSAIAAIVRMALDGIGICVLPPAVVRAELQDGRMRILDVAADLPAMDFYLNVARDKDAPLARQVSDLVVEIARTPIETTIPETANPAVGLNGFIDGIQIRD